MSIHKVQDKQKITPFLWFDTQAEEAANFYVSVFSGLPGRDLASGGPNSKILTSSRYDEAGAKVSGRPVGSVMVISFELNGQEFNALNGGPLFKFSEAISFAVNCENQEEVDHLWESLSADPTSEQCGWCKDKFGLSWQIVPKQLGEMISKDTSGKVMQAMLQMKKIDISKLQEAFEGK